MIADDDTVAGPFGRISRRSAIGSTLLAGAAFLAVDSTSAQEPRGAAAAVPAKRYDMKKSINLWAFPYPERMTLARVPAARQGRRLRRHRAELRPRERPLAEGRPEGVPGDPQRWPSEIGIAISGLCSFLFWPYSLTDNDPATRTRGLELAGRMIEAAHDLGTENLLVVPGAVHIPWRTDHEPVPNDVVRPPRPRGDRQAAAPWPKNWASR